MVQVNSDGVMDVVIGFGTGADGYNIPDFVCDIYFDGQKPCLGGVLALDGKVRLINYFKMTFDHPSLSLCTVSLK